MCTTRVKENPQELFEERSCSDTSNNFSSNPSSCTKVRRWAMAYDLMQEAKQFPNSPEKQEKLLTTPIPGYSPRRF